MADEIPEALITGALPGCSGYIMQLLDRRVTLGKLSGNKALAVPEYVDNPHRPCAFADIAILAIDGY